ncbi:hypothetical protein F5Y14DRAFT_430297 [Nemania sp. NC0429]|nr:hypothetical protein F5Y14DRAFT_430297 [Nemania sp. NC0429]
MVGCDIETKSPHDDGEPGNMKSAATSLGDPAEAMPTRAIGAKDGDGDGSEREMNAPAHLLRWTGDDDDATRTNIHDAAQLRAQLQEEAEGVHARPRHLFIFHGLPVAYGAVLREAGGVDAGFVAAHAGRRRYYGPSSQTAGSVVAWAHFDYPELFVRRLAPAPAASTFDERRRGGEDGDGDDLLGAAPAYATSGVGDGVAFCRASVWISGKGHVLLLDGAAWENAKAGSAGRHRAYDGTEKTPDGNGVVPVVAAEIDAAGPRNAPGDETPSFETLLVDGLRGGCAGSDDPEDLVEMIGEIAVRKWDEFFEALGVDWTFAFGEGGEAEVGIAAPFAQMLRCLERNLGVSRLRRGIGRRPVDASLDARSGALTMEWEALLSRLDRRAHLLRHLKPVVAVSVPARRPSAETKPSTAGSGVGILSGVGAHDDDVRSYKSRKSAYAYNADMTTAASAREESQRSLNRVAYLGGVLLPFTVVSGILAIQAPFGPGNPQFWIFWAVSVPLVLATLGIVYADSIRKVEVWVEVAAAASSTSDDAHENNNNAGRSEQVVLPIVDVEQGVAGVPMSRIFKPASLSPELEFEPSTRFQGLRGLMRLGEEAEDDVEGEEEGEGEGGGEGIQGEQGTFIEKLWQTHAPRDTGSGPEFHRTRRGRGKKWRKEELGWMGAFATMFRVYKLKKGVRPDRMPSRRRGMF